MAGRYVQGSIAGVEILGPANRPSRIETVDAEGLSGTLTGTSAQALNFTVHTQLSARGVKGVHFGVRVSFLLISKLKAITAAIEDALGSGSDFAVSMADAGSGVDKADDFNVRCVPDFQSLGGKLYTRGALSGDYVRDVTFRFISTAIGE
jgi:hypothetical protein